MKTLSNTDAELKKVVLIKKDVPSIKHHILIFVVDAFN